MQKNKVRIETGSTAFGTQRRTHRPAEREWGVGVIVGGAECLSGLLILDRKESGGRRRTMESVDELP